MPVYTWTCIGTPRLDYVAALAVLLLLLLCVVVWYSVQ